MPTINIRKDQDGYDRYQVIVRLKGHPTQTATFKRLTDARKWGQQTESAIREGRHFKLVEAKKHTLAALIDRYLIQIKPPIYKKAQLLWWIQKIGKYLLADVTPALIASYRDELLDGITKQGKIRNPSTVVRYMAALSHVFTICVKEYGWIESSPMTRVTKPTEPSGRMRYLSDDERSRLLAACETSDNDYLYLVVVIALSTGMRQGEIMNLKWSHVDIERKHIVLDKTKNKTQRMIPIEGRAFELLRHHMIQNQFKNTMLFPGLKVDKPMDLRKAWHAALRKAQILNFRFHDLRHSAASYLAMSGCSLLDISQILGHKNLNMTKRYSHLSQSHLSKVISKMNEEIFG